MRDLWVFDQPDAQCARCTGALGRSVTFAASARPVGANVTGSPSMQFCADAEAAFLPTIRASCDEETSIVREAAFASPWEAYCGYTATYLPALSSSGCGGVAAPLPEVVRCQSVLKHFATVGCARNASAYDWDAFCDQLGETRVPDALSTLANCSDACVASVRAADTGAFAKTVTGTGTGHGQAVSFLPEECEDTGAWEAHDWSGHCTKLAENKLEGYCSAAVCACREQGGWKAGDACELSCPMGADFSPCSEASFGGTCAYPRTNERPRTRSTPTRRTTKSATSNCSRSRCVCRHRDAMPEDGCRVDCSEGAQACNPREYTSDNDTFQISTCDPGGSGVCAATHLSPARPW